MTAGPDSQGNLSLSQKPFIHCLGSRWREGVLLTVPCLEQLRTWQNQTVSFRAAARLSPLRAPADIFTASLRVLVFTSLGRSLPFSLEVRLMQRTEILD